MRFYELVIVVPASSKTLDAGQLTAMIVNAYNSVYYNIFVVDRMSVEVGGGRTRKPGRGWRSLARALIAFHLATAHEQRRLAKMKKKIITSTSFRDWPDLGRSERQRPSYITLSSFLFFQRASFPEGGRVGGAGAGGEGPK